jgi:hypothetical protein
VYANTFQVNRLNGNPRAMLQIIESLDRCGFKANFKFSDDILELIIRKKLVE